MTTATMLTCVKCGAELTGGRDTCGPVDAPRCDACHLAGAESQMRRGELIDSLHRARAEYDQARVKASLMEDRWRRERDFEDRADYERRWQDALSEADALLDTVERLRAEIHLVEGECLP